MNEKFFFIPLIFFIITEFCFFSSKKRKQAEGHGLRGLLPSLSWPESKKIEGATQRKGVANNFPSFLSFSSKWFES